MRTRLVTGAVVAATAALLAAPSSAASTVAIDTVSVSGSTVTVTGTAAFDALTGAAPVGGTVTTTSPAAAAFAPAGVELKSASIAELADGKGLRFTWQLASLPASVPPEGTRYTWAFTVDGKPYQLQAKRTNAGSLTVADDAPGHVQALSRNGFFQLRGNCVAAYPAPPSNVANCPHLAFLTGSFDTAKAQVTMDLPYASAAAPAIKPGAALVPNQTAGMSITSAFQAAVSNTNTSMYINDWATYFTGKTVQVATGFADDDATSLTYGPATLTASSFTGSTAVADGADTVFVRACQATTCVYDTAAL